LSLTRARDTWGAADFWLNTKRPPDNERALWVGAGTRDTGLPYISDHPRHGLGYECRARLYRR
jgi:hypothetical protein